MRIFYILDNCRIWFKRRFHTNNINKSPRKWKWKIWSGLMNTKKLNFILHFHFLSDFYQNYVNIFLIIWVKMFLNNAQCNFYYKMFFWCHMSIWPTAYETRSTIFWNSHWSINYKLFFILIGSYGRLSLGLWDFRVFFMRTSM